MMVLNITILCYSALLLVLISTVLHRQFVRPKTAQTPDHLPDISIVIPFRNEQSNLEPLITSLSKQDYPGKVEIVLINDNSDDQSVHIIKNSIPACKYQLTLCDSHYDPSRKLTSKQQAIDTGIRAAAYDSIVFTDADMTFKNGWLISLGKQLANGADLAFSRTSVQTNDKNPFSWFQAFQLDFLFCVAYSFFYTRITGSCMGNNMAISRAKYYQTGGYTAIGYSIVEDRALFAAFRKQHFTCAIAEPFYALAVTYPCTTGTSLFHQMRRWARGGFSMSSTLFPVGIIFAIHNLLLCLLPFHIIPVLSEYLTVVNFLLTWFFTALCFYTVKSDLSPWYFPVFYLFMLMECIVFIVSLILFPTIKWKERKLQK